MVLDHSAVIATLGIPTYNARRKLMNVARLHVIMDTAKMNFYLTHAVVQMAIQDFTVTMRLMNAVLTPALKDVSVSMKYCLTLVYVLMAILVQSVHRD